MLHALALVAVSAATQPPDPSTLPIPTGRAGDDGWFGGIEVTTQLLFRFTWGYQDRWPAEGRELVWRPGGLSGAWDARTVTTEETRTSELKRLSPGPGPAAVTRVVRFIADTFSASRETYQTRWGRAVNVSYWWYPAEGIALYVGCDLSRLDVYAGIRFFF